MPPRKPTAVPWDRVEAAPLVLITGPEELLAERAIARLIQQGLQAEPEAEVVQVDATSEASQGVQAAAAGSLFATSAIVVARGVEQLTDSFLEDSLAYLANPNPEAMVIWRHRAGQRGKKLLDALRAAGAKEAACQAIKYDQDKTAFVIEEFRAADRLIDRGAVQALIEAVGADLMELAASCQQLVADTSGRISRDMVDRYYSGRAQATAFAVAEAAVVGDVAKAAALARHAMGSGTEPLQLVSALAAKLRTMAQVGGAKRAGLDPVKDLKISPWLVSRARQTLQKWDGPALGQAILAVAQADAEIKGLGGVPGKVGRAYVAERAIMFVAQHAAD